MFWYEKPPHSVCGGELLNVAKQKLFELYWLVSQQNSLVLIFDSMHCSLNIRTQNPTSLFT